MSTTSTTAEPPRDRFREMLLSDYNVPEAVVHYCTEGMLDTIDLWWLYDNYRIMATGDAWLLAMMWENKLTDEEAEPLSNPSFWAWFDAGDRRKCPAQPRNPARPAGPHRLSIPKESCSYG